MMMVTVRVRIENPPDGTLGDPTVYYLVAAGYAHGSRIAACACGDRVELRLRPGGPRLLARRPCCTARAFGQLAAAVAAAGHGRDCEDLGDPVLAVVAIDGRRVGPITEPDVLEADLARRGDARTRAS